MKKVLIANRGEIALRIARACRDHGVLSVAVYADCDADAPYVRFADEAHGLHGDTPAETYLDIGKLLDIAKRTGADAVHPGYGFLSERAEFARGVVDAGLTWIGPAASVIEALGDKTRAREIASRVGAPLVPGSDGPVANAAEALAFAEAHGLPIAIKAAFGGGGRGMKVAWKLDEVEELFASATREAEAAFGRGECFVERFLDRPRHVEAQILADSHGTVLVVGTRDCSLQRRNQKLVEEAPAPFLTPEQRERIHEGARAVCAEAGYVGAGTVEFLLGQDGTISFLEVNTRLQVEHPVTEETTGLDLVVEQLRIADGERLELTETPEPRGHSIEFRINAEDPARGFLPMPGPIDRFEPPAGPGVRVDSGVVSGSVIPGHFDSMMAKLVVTGPTREIAIARARRALAEFTIEGVPTVLPFHSAVLEADDFTGDTFRVHTRWIETDFAAELEAAARPAPAEGPAMLRVPVELDGRRHVLGLPAAFLARLGSPAGGAGIETEAPSDPGLVGASVAGTLQGWRVENGAPVEEGQVIAVMEAMKMETQVTAPISGVIELVAQAGAYLQAGEPLARIVFRPS
ncbi:biotin carboxylase N-terminal domain-containing protein [Aureimonas sp. ME7]|uniref:acetyl/propionyl/methylcrotonyl-CoA carboxylase subunit alpha n=1 Tax=Aureimonas sp. ME7 TaxID=2744252 RepID=UPI0015F666E9|nr:biotin carboxylase N-terminal domain-containing protein [Aureimonas sp. ME7]